MDQKELRQQLVLRFPRERRYLLPALHYVQHELAHLPEFALQMVGWHLHIPASEVYGAATSYTELRVFKPGAHVVRVCTGLPCMLNGAQAVLGAVRQALSAPPGQPAVDSRAAVEETACAFACAMAPVLEVDGRLHGRVTGEQATTIARELGSPAHPAPVEGGAGPGQAGG